MPVPRQELEVLRAADRVEQLEQELDLSLDWLRGRREALDWARRGLPRWRQSAPAA